MRGSIVGGLNLYTKEYWTLDNPINNFARLDAKGPSGLGSPPKVFDRSFIRLENISIGYTLPKEITRKWDIETVKIYGNIRNVAVWAKDSDWRGNYWDPETDGLAPRVFTLGLNLIF